MKPFKELLKIASKSSITVLLQGESGTGKEVAARFLHRESDRCRGPFVALNCGAIAKNLAESTLEGAKKGAFTGATADQPGVVRSAHGGTLFLDEIGEMSFDMQSKLLRILQERSVMPLGSTTAIPVDFRLVCATNKNLKAEVSAGRFREDLFFRLSTFPIQLPPLRDREDFDIIANEIWDIESHAENLLPPYDDYRLSDIARRNPARRILGKRLPRNRVHAADSNEQEPRMARNREHIAQVRRQQDANSPRPRHKPQQPLPANKKSDAAFSASVANGLEKSLEPKSESQVVIAALECGARFVGVVEYDHANEHAETAADAVLGPVLRTHRITGAEHQRLGVRKLATKEPLRIGIGTAVGVGRKMQSPLGAKRHKARDARLQGHRRILVLVFVFRHVARVRERRGKGKVAVHAEGTTDVSQEGERRGIVNRLRGKAETARPVEHLVAATESGLQAPGVSAVIARLEAFLVAALYFVVPEKIDRTGRGETFTHRECEIGRRELVHGGTIHDNLVDAEFRNFRSAHGERIAGHFRCTGNIGDTGARHGGRSRRNMHREELHRRSTRIHVPVLPGKSEGSCSKGEYKNFLQHTEYKIQKIISSSLP